MAYDKQISLTGMAGVYCCFSGVVNSADDDPIDVVLYGIATSRRVAVPARCLDRSAIYRPVLTPIRPLAKTAN
jgi:hypothetical protein